MFCCLKTLPFLKNLNILNHSCYTCWNNGGINLVNGVRNSSINFRRNYSKLDDTEVTTQTRIDPSHSNPPSTPQVPPTPLTNDPASRPVSFSVLKSEIGSNPGLSIRPRGYAERDAICINMPAYVQRNCVKHRIKYPTPSPCLLTNLEWGALVPGLCAAMNSFGPPVQHFYGPKGTFQLLQSVVPNLFSGRKSTKILQQLRVTESHDDVVTSEENGFQIKMVKVKPESFLQSDLVAYIILTPLYKPLFCFHKCKDHGISFQRRKLELKEDFVAFKAFKSELIKGNMAINPETGETINPEDLKYEGPGFQEVYGVVECPSLDYLPALVENSEFSKYFAANESKMNEIAHITPQDVFDSGSYQSWIQKFGDNCRHVVANESYNLKSAITLPDTVREAQNCVSDQFFPFYQGHPYSCLEQAKQLFKQDDFNEHSFKNPLMNSELMKVKKVLDVIPHCPSNTSHRDCLKYVELNSMSDFPRLVVLGSGSNMCHKHRAHPAYLLRLNQNTSLLIDCGDGTFTQLYNHFGPKYYREVLESIKVITISHRHTDHCIGLVHFLKQMVKLKRGRMDGKVSVFLPGMLRRFMLEYAGKYERYLLNHVYFHAIERYNEGQDIQRIFKGKLKTDEFKFINVVHGVKTYALSLVYNGFKLVYATDTAPMVAELIQGGKNADLLLHDSSYVDDTHLADLNLHSTMQGAVDTADAMNAKALMLIHFAGKTPVVPFTHRPPFTYKGPIIAAYDHMELPLNSEEGIVKFAALHQDMLHIHQGSLERTHWRKTMMLGHNVDSELKSDAACV